MSQEGRCSPVAAASANSQAPKASLHTHSEGVSLHTCSLSLVPIWAVGFHAESTMRHTNISVVFVQPDLGLALDISYLTPQLRGWYRIHFTDEKT